MKLIYTLFVSLSLASMAQARTSLITFVLNSEAVQTKLNAIESEHGQIKSINILQDGMTESIPVVIDFSVVADLGGETICQFYVSLIGKTFEEPAKVVSNTEVTCKKSSNN